MPHVLFRYDTPVKRRLARAARLVLCLLGVAAGGLLLASYGNTAQVGVTATLPPSAHDHSDVNQGGFLGNTQATSMRVTGAQGFHVSGGSASFSGGPVGLASATFQGQATPSSATARSIFFDTDRDRLVYTTKNGTQLSVDPTYIFANNWEERPGNGTCTDSWFMSFQANVSTAIYRASETTVKRPFGAQGTIVSMTCASNNNTQTVTLRLRKNGTNVGQALTMAPGPVYNIAQSSGNALAIPVTSTDTITVQSSNNFNCLSGQPPAGCTLVVAPGVN